MKIMRSAVIEAPIDTVWSAVRNFDSAAAWMPGVIKARMESGSPAAPGSIRCLDIADGSVFRENLLTHSDADRFYTYGIVESPLPCTDYVSEHRLIPITDGGMTLSVWSGEFNCSPADAKKLEMIFGDLTYRDGMRGLNAHLKKQN